MIVKLIFLILVLWAGLRLYRMKDESRADKQRELPKDQEMVSCEVCGVYLPEDEAVDRDGHYYCSKEHARITR